MARIISYPEHLIFRISEIRDRLHPTQYSTRMLPSPLSGPAPSAGTAPSGIFMPLPSSSYSSPQSSSSPSLHGIPASYDDLRSISHGHDGVILKHNDQSMGRANIADIISHLQHGDVTEALDKLRRLNLEASATHSQLPQLPLHERNSQEAIMDALIQQSKFLAESTQRSGAPEFTAEKVTFTKFKNIGIKEGQTRLEDCIWTWENEFEIAKIPYSVSRVLTCMLPDGNLFKWSMAFRSTTMNPTDPEDIKNWSWTKFRQNIFQSTLYIAPDKNKIRLAFNALKCDGVGTRDQLDTYTTDFLHALQNLRMHNLQSVFSDEHIAQHYYDRLPDNTKTYLSLKDPSRDEIRTDLAEVMQSVRELLKWKVYLDAIGSDRTGRLVGAQGITNSNSPQSAPSQIGARIGEVAQYSKTSPMFAQWLDAKGSRFKYRHKLTKGGNYHVIIGTPQQLEALFANGAAKAAGLKRNERNAAPNATPGSGAPV
jgi:hypothetical protein